MATTERAHFGPIDVDVSNPEFRFRCPNGHRNWVSRGHHIRCEDCARQTYSDAVHGLLWDKKEQTWVHCQRVNFVR
jgi:hypothetical protein